MKKKELNEIKKAIKSDDFAITDVWATYVNMTKEIIFSTKTNFVVMNEEIREVYAAIFSKVLSGAQGRNLLTLNFLPEEEIEGGKQDILYKTVRDATGEKYQDLIDKIIENYNPKSNYAILIAKGSYDIPRKASDGEFLEDSEDVYNFMVVAICSMNLTKPSLCYKSEQNDFVENPRNWTVQMPDTGFLYPTFTNRQRNIYECLYYTRKVVDIHEEFIDGVLGCEMKLNPVEQKEKFNEIIENNLPDLKISDFVELNKNIAIFTEELKNEGETPKLKSRQLKQFLTSAGAENVELEDDLEIMAENVTNKSYNIVSGGNITIRTNNDGIAFIEQRVIDGRPCLVIPMDEVELNGIKLK
ncbi:MULTISPECIES: DUF4317 family protein [Helcococcus]|uniref:DUF4317 family protein n=1 Tax=Helcococcus bovis TaxID=3153252 RepID=A0ABW9F8T6_9FIRM